MMDQNQKVIECEIEKSLLAVLKAFLKSIQIILPSILYLSENSMTSSIVLTASKMVLP